MTRKREEVRAGERGQKRVLSKNGKATVHPHVVYAASDYRPRRRPPEVGLGSHLPSHRRRVVTVPISDNAKTHSGREKHRELTQRPCTHARRPRHQYAVSVASHLPGMEKCVTRSECRKGDISILYGARGE
ncbi:hypothetical protein EVAR_79549_1 [Eumeta japonica]|uniref:Uncharacterized protein n=1 Tax=Eumeta variegata TaxID=151549 RepID=A0A4C1UE05_EUMVA|nr:hypothetical protein EVAR_79549_1 [Eumeta japonica]